MTKRELVMLIAERFGYTQHEVGDVVQATLDTITEALAEGQRLEIRNFGVFEIKTRDARVGRNPRTGEEVPIAEKRVASFKPGKALKELVEGGVQSGQGASEEPGQAQREPGAGHPFARSEGSEEPSPRSPEPPRRDAF